MAGTSYTRQSTLTDGDTITAALFNNEFNLLFVGNLLLSKGVDTLLEAFSLIEKENIQSFKPINTTNFKKHPKNDS